MKGQKTESREMEIYPNELTQIIGEEKWRAIMDASMETLKVLDANQLCCRKLPSREYCAKPNTAGHE